jgi:flagellar biosynthesis/type III secretory pathway chaperone
MTPGAQLASLLAREIECVEQLREVLDRERLALLEADAPALEQVTREKNRVLGNQVEATRLRLEYIEQSGLAASGEPMDTFIAASDNGQELAECRQQLQELARQCHEANRNNGRMIARKQQHTLGALGILRQSETASPTYSGVGGALDNRSSRLLGKA